MIMKQTDLLLSQKVTNNLVKILKDRNLKQAYLTKLLDTSESQVSKKLKGDIKITLDELSKIANGLALREIDIITYPDVYTLEDAVTTEPVEAILQIKLQREKKEQVLKLVFGENDIEILNK